MVGAKIANFWKTLRAMMNEFEELKKEKEKKKRKRKTQEQFSDFSDNVIRKPWYAMWNF